jgi:membrane-bound lytic murein transglycosylase B
MALPGLLMGLLIALALAGGTVLPHATDAAPVPNGPERSGVPSDGPEVPSLPWEPGTDPLHPSTSASIPGATATPSQQASDSLSAWAAPMAVRTEIPLVALEAYAAAEIRLAQTTPGCGLRWTTLAGIGRVESNHGQSNGATLTTDGRSLPPIYGPLLDGTGGTKRIEDTDDGQLDGDSTLDRAIGPMQFIPSTWRTYAVDADGSGTPDPHDIHDAALAAANLLCAGNGNLATPQGWWDAIRRYNEPQAYAQNVFTRANNYGIASRS